MLCLHVNRITFEFPDKKRERERDSLGFPYRKVNVSSSTSIIINYYYYKGIG